MLNKLTKGLGAATILTTAVALAYAGTITGTGTVVSKTMTKKSYNQSRDRNYKIYVPKSYNGSTAVPMVIALHGCSQTQDTVLQEWDLELLADTNNFILVAPFITTYDGTRNQNCWGFWFDHHIHKGAGEVEDIKQIGMQVEGLYKIDPNRRYLLGLSSGGGMTVAGAVAQNTYFAAAAASAGLAYGETASSVKLNSFTTPTFETPETTAASMNAEMGSNKRQIPFMVVNNNVDDVVLKQAALNITAAHLIVWGTGKTQAPSSTVDCAFEGVSCTHKKWTNANGTIVEQVLYNGSSSAGTRGHYWGGDDTGTYAYATGPSTSKIMWEFLKTKSLSGGGGTTTTTSGGTTTTTATTTTTTAGACFSASNYAHVTAGRAYNSAGYAKANGSNQNMGLNNTFITTKLRMTGPNYYVIDTTCP